MYSIPCCSFSAHAHVQRVGQTASEAPTTHYYAARRRHWFTRRLNNKAARQLAANRSKENPWAAGILPGLAVIEADPHRRFCVRGVPHIAAGGVVRLHDDVLHTHARNPLHERTPARAHTAHTQNLLRSGYVFRMKDQHAHAHLRHNAPLAWANRRTMSSAGPSCGSPLPCQRARPFSTARRWSGEWGKSQIAQPPGSSARASQQRSPSIAST